MTASPEQIAGLVERVKSATGGVPALAREIQCAIGGWHRITPSQGGGKHGGYISSEDWNGRGSDGRPILDSLHGTTIWRDVPDVTASVDAALALIERVLPGWLYTADSSVRGVQLFSRAWPDGPSAYGDGATMPLAYVAALLTALQLPSHEARHHG